MPNPTVPTLHLNGSGHQALYDQYCEAVAAIRVAIGKLPCPNARDYYVAGDGVFQKARDEHHARVQALAAVRDELYAILENIADQRDRRANG